MLATGDGGGGAVMRNVSRIHIFHTMCYFNKALYIIYKLICKTYIQIMYIIYIIYMYTNR